MAADFIFHLLDMNESNNDNNNNLGRCRQDVNVAIVAVVVVVVVVDSDQSSYVCLSALELDKFLTRFLVWFGSV